MKLVHSVDEGSAGFVEAGDLHQDAEITAGKRITLRKPNVDYHLTNLGRSVKGQLEFASKLDLVNHFLHLLMHAARALLQPSQH